MTVDEKDFKIGYRALKSECSILDRAKIVDFANNNDLDIGFEEDETYYKLVERDINISKSLQIQLLKGELKKTDYLVIKFAEGELTEKEYEPYRKQRKEWRKRIKELENQ